MRVFATHDHADFDGFAAMLAARLLYGGGEIVVGRPLDRLVHAFLALHKDRFEPTPIDAIDPAGVEELVVVDTRQRRRLRSVAKLLLARDEGRAAFRVETWDHHRARPDDLPAELERAEPVGAVVTLLVEALQRAGTPIDAPSATAMALGIHTDTGSLTFSGTTPRDAAALAHLLACGASLGVVRDTLRGGLDAEQQRVLSQTLAGMQRLDLRGVRVGVVECAATGGGVGLAEVVSAALGMTELDALFLGWRTASGKLTIVGRANAPWVDVGAAMTALGGGGHAGAGSVTLRGDAAASGMDALLQLLDEAIHDPPRVRDLMTGEVFCLDAGLTMAQAEVALQRRGVHGAPVLRDGAMVGVLSRRDIERARGRDDMDRAIAAGMATHVRTVAPNVTLDDAHRVMVSHDIGRLPVVDATGAVVGLLSRSDVLRTLYGRSSVTS